MRKSSYLPALLACLVALGAAPAFAQQDDSDKDEGTKNPASPGAQNPFDQGVAPEAGDMPVKGALYEEGADGKYLIGGRWYFRQDASDQGIRAGFARTAQTDGWQEVGVPHVWNATDLTRESMFGSVGWYRKDFRVPNDAAARAWVIRFEGANYRLRAWLNGREIGTHEGAFLPFELPASGLNPNGVNRLVLRIDSRTNQFDLPPGGDDGSGEPDGGWWNYGGLPREVYLRRVGSADFRDVLVRSDLRCRTCAADARVVVRAKNTSSQRRQVKVLGTFGTRRLRFRGPRRLAAGATGVFTASLTLQDPALWSPGSPSLYGVRLRLNAGGNSRPAWFVRHGVRSLEVARGGVMRLNGRPVRLRGASIHEDDIDDGSALTARRRQADMDLLRRLGATVTRAHYPLHPYTLELADRMGILVWNQAPVYQLRAPQLGNLPLRRRSVDFMREQVLRDRNHPSVFAWSLVNELPARPGSGQEALIQQMAVAVRKLDPSRLVALDIQGYPTVGPQEAYRILDAIGINDYFGWYPGPNGTIADRAGLGPYLDQMHAAYPDQALFVTEFGAEANRDGPLDEKGTYAFQRDLLRYHLGVFDQRSFINGALIWILRDFRVKPGWEGGNPKPDPPVNFKGLVTMDGREKPSFGEIARLFRATTQVR